MRTVVERLAAYENTGLMPGEIMALQTSFAAAKKEALAVAGGCYCAECRFSEACSIKERIDYGHELYHKTTPPFCSFGELDPDILNAPSLGELAGPDSAVGEK